MFDWQRIPWQDLGIYPLLFVLPFMFLPKVIDGDTQPWVISTALLAFLTFRPSEFLRMRDLILVAISALCVVAFAWRAQADFLLIRTCYMHIAFVMLWFVCRREKGDFFPAAVRYTIALWFVFGLYEFISVSTGHGLGVPEMLSGRFGEGRSGVPGLTAEPSFYGSLSALQMMYLLSRHERRNLPYIILAAVSVVLSGSLLASLMLLFPFFKLNWRWKLLTLATVPFLILGSFLISAGGIVSRLSFLQATDAASSMSGNIFDMLLLDGSLSIRIGNIYFTLYHHLWQSLTLMTPVHYKQEYTQFCLDQGIWYDPTTEYTIPFAGELVYGSGIFGLLLMVALIAFAQARSKTLSTKCEKAVFLVACFLNPITIANPFLSIYALGEDRSQDARSTSARSS